MQAKTVSSHLKWKQSARGCATKSPELFSRRTEHHGLPDRMPVDAIGNQMSQFICFASRQSKDKLFFGKQRFRRACRRQSRRMSSFGHDQEKVFLHSAVGDNVFEGIFKNGLHCFVIQEEGRVFAHCDPQPETKTQLEKSVSILS